MITINGKQKEGYDGLMLSDILEQEGYDIRRIAVEINGNIVPKSAVSRTMVNPADHMEVVSFVGGG